MRRTRRGLLIKLLRGLPDFLSLLRTISPPLLVPPSFDPKIYHMLRTYLHSISLPKMYSRSPSATNSGDIYAHSSADHVQGPPRKKMRKGTKSCLECRRRKIKCTFEENRPAVCNECFARGSTCIDQEHGDMQPAASTTSAEQSYSLRERVTQLEGLVREVLNRLPEGKGKDNTSPSGGSGHGETQAGRFILRCIRRS